jgi:hypothetical protein
VDSPEEALNSHGGTPSPPRCLRRSVATPRTAALRATGRPSARGGEAGLLAYRWNTKRAAAPQARCPPLAAALRSRGGAGAHGWVLASLRPLPRPHNAHPGGSASQCSRRAPPSRRSSGRASRDAWARLEVGEAQNLLFTCCSFRSSRQRVASARVSLPACGFHLPKPPIWPLEFCPCSSCLSGPPQRHLMFTSLRSQPCCAPLATSPLRPHTSTSNHSSNTTSILKQTPRLHRADHSTQTTTAPCKRRLGPLHQTSLALFHTSSI